MTRGHFHRKLLDPGGSLGTNNPQCRQATIDEEGGASEYRMKDSEFMRSYH